MGLCMELEIRCLWWFVDVENGACEAVECVEKLAAPDLTCAEISGLRQNGGSRGHNLLVGINPTAMINKRNAPRSEGAHNFPPRCCRDLLSSIGSFSDEGVSERKRKNA